MNPNRGPDLEGDESVVPEDIEATLIFDAYRASVAAGQPLDWEPLLAQHPALADRLRSLLAVEHMIAAVAGIFLLAGLWTPLAGTLVVGVELWVSLAVRGDLWTSLLFAALGASLAMVGPGAWSVDARIFGRKRIKVSSR